MPDNPYPYGVVMWPDGTYDALDPPTRDGQFVPRNRGVYSTQCATGRTTMPGPVRMNPCYDDEPRKKSDDSLLTAAVCAASFGAIF